MYSHPEKHPDSDAPVLGCSDCDKEIDRPIPLCHGDGASSSVLQPKKVKTDGTE